MTFEDFCEHLAKIEATAKRLLMTSLLSELLKQADAQEVDKVVILALGRLAPLYKDIDFGLAEKTTIRSLASAYNLETKIVVERFKKVGDLGEVASELKLKAQISKLKTKTQILKLSVTDVFNRLSEIASQSGEKSQERKVNKTADLLRELDPLGAKYAVRIILGNLRLGFSDKTVLDALSVMVAGDKSAREKLEAAYNVRPDVGWLAKKIQNSEFRIQNLRPEPELGVPILPALCQRLPAAEEIIEKMCRPSGRASSIEESGRKVAVEPKWDGQRLQAHVRLQPSSKFKVQSSKLPEINLFTRSLEDVTDMFPDLVNGLRALIQHSSFGIQNCILDGEAVAIDPAAGRFLPFQTMITRKRKYGIAEKLADVPVRYMVFDILYLNGKSLMNEKFSERRKLLEKLMLEVGSENVDNEVRSAKSNFSPPGPASHINPLTSKTSILELAPQLITSAPTEIRKFLKQQIDSGLEGIVAKRSDAPYIPGRTQFAWVKLKWEGAAKSGGLLDTVDCVVMGTYAGRGKRSSFGAGAFLVGIADSSSSKLKVQSSKFVTVSKIGTGLTDEQWRELRVQSSEFRVQSCPKEYEVPKELTPDAWLRPELVVEIQADNITKSPLHTAGYALRFPRLVRYRTDKRADQVTTAEEVKKLYEISSRKPRLRPR